MYGSVMILFRNSFFPLRFCFFLVIEIYSSLCVSLVRVFVKAATKRQCYREGNFPGRKMGPGQGGSRLELGLGGRIYLGRSLGPGQGGSQDYFAKKGGSIIHINCYHVEQPYTS